MRSPQLGDVYQHCTLLSYIFTVIMWNDETNQCRIWWNDTGVCLTHKLNVIIDSVESEQYHLLAGFK